MIGGGRAIAAARRRFAGRRPARLRWGIVALLIGAAVQSPATPCAPPDATFTAVRFAADGWIDAAGLQTLAGLETPGAWDREREADVRAKLLATQVFRSVEAELVAEAEDCVLVVALEKRRRVTAVELTGAALPPFAAVRSAWRWITRNEDRAPPPTEREIRRLIPLRPGSVFEQAALDRGTARILEKYHAVGYPSASVATRVRERGGGVEIAVHVEPGKPRLVTQVELRADDPEARRIVEEVLQERLGGPEVRRLERETRREILRRLREGGFFESRVEVSWNRIDATSGQLVAEVEVGPQQQIVVYGNESVGEGDLIPRQELYERMFISRNTWRQVAAGMQHEYQRRGFYDASVQLVPERQDIVYEVQEGRRFKVGRVRFRGNHALADEDLRQVVATGSGGVLSFLWPPRVIDETVEEDVERIRVRYVRAGFESVEVTKSVELDEERGVADVLFTVEEGPRTYVRSVAGDEVLAGIGLRADAAPVGAPLDVVALENERERLRAELRRNSYFGAVVDVEVERQPAGDTVDARVLWQIEPGPLHVVGDVAIQGNWDVRYVVITRDLPFERGDVIDTAALRDVQQEIYDSGVFRSVSIAPTQLDEDMPADAVEESEEIERTLAVRVAPRPPGRVAYGFGYDTRQGLTGFAELGYANLNHRAQRLRLRGQIGFDPGDKSEPTQYLGTIEFVEPRLLNGPWTYQINGLAERNTRTIDAYNIQRFSVATGLSRELWTNLHVGGDLQVEHASVFDVLPAPFRERDEQNAWTTTLIPYFVYDGRDSVFNPRSGIFESLRLRYALPGISRVDLVELVGQHTQLIPLWKDWNFVYSVRVGWIRSLDGDPIVPIRNRYFLGGGESVRGFAVNSLGPYDGNGEDVGGDLAIVTKTELRIPIIWELGLVLFVDGGANYLTRCDSECRAGDPGDPATMISDAAVSLDNFRTSAGVGLRYVTPVGPISVDYGIKLDRRTRTLADGSTDRESFGEFSVSIGARF